MKPVRKHGSDVVRTPECRCLNCGHLLDATGTGDLTLEAKPEPGDVTVCMYCGAAMMLDKDLRVRGMTEAEINELVNDPEWMDQVAKLVRAVHFVKHQNS